MPRSRNTDAKGRSFDAATVERVWRKATPRPGQDSSVWRRDRCGIPIKRDAHGNTKSPNAWEIDHIKPVAKGGTDDLSNLQPLQWELNRDKGDTYPWSCPS